MKKVIIGSLLAVLIIAVVAVNVLRSNGTLPAFSGGKVYDVKVSKIEKGSISSSVSASGIIEEIEKAEVFFDTPMKVKKLLVESSKRVKKGDRLVELDMDSLASELEQLMISKTTQELNIKKIKMMDNTRSTASLKVALDIARNNVASAESAYNDAVKALESTKALYEAGAASKNEYDRAVKTKGDLELALNNANLNLKNAEDNLNQTQKDNIQSDSSKDIDLTIQQKNLESTMLRINDLEKKIQKIMETVLSPIDGAITSIAIEEGGFTSSMQAAFSLVNPEKLQIKVDVKEYDIKNVKVGQDVLVSGDAISKDDEVTGKVQSISPIARKVRTTNGEETLVEVIISIEKGVPVLKPGLSVTTDIITNVKEDALIASFGMLKDDKDGNKLVFVIDDTLTMNQRIVKLGITSDLDAEVIEGLNEGDLVVVDPQPVHKDGIKVKIKEDTAK